MQKGNQANEFIEMAAPFEKKIYLTCYSFLGSRQDAEDALQETMLRAFRSFNRFRREAQIQTWLRKIAVHVCIDMTRKRKNILSIEDIQEDGEELKDSSPGPYDSLERTERMRILSEALDEMRPEARTLIILRDVQGLPYEEIADILSQPVGTVKSGLNRARSALQKKLNQHADLFARSTVSTEERRKPRSELR